MALVDAQIVAAMRRTIANDHVEFKLHPYRALTPAERSKPSTRPPDGTASTYGSVPASPCRAPPCRQLGGLRSGYRAAWMAVASRLAASVRSGGSSIENDNRMWPSPPGPTKNREPSR